MSLIFATQLTAVATAALAVFALAAAILAALAFRKQAQEVGILQRQSTREAQEHRMAQAARVYTGIPRTVSIHGVSARLWLPAIK
jgi:hypothetical protein